MGLPVSAKVLCRLDCLRVDRGKDIARLAGIGRLLLSPFPRPARPSTAGGIRFSHPIDGMKFCEVIEDRPTGSPGGRCENTRKHATTSPPWSGVNFDEPAGKSVQGP